MLSWLRNRRQNEKVLRHDLAVADFRVAGMTSNTPEAIAAAHGVLDTFDDLHDGNPPVDMTPRIDGVPVIATRARGFRKFL